MTKTDFLKLFKAQEGDCYSIRPLVKVKVFFSDGYWEFNCQSNMLKEVRKTIRSILLPEDFKKIIGIEF